jgi:hypothetical protein
MYLLGVLTAIRYKNGNRTNVDTQTNRDAHKSVPDGPISVMCIPPAITDQERANQKKKNRRKSIKFWAEIVGLIVLTFYTAFTYKIMRANLNAAKSAHDTLGEIQKQTTLIRQQLVGSQAAIVRADRTFVVDDGLPSTARLEIAIQNEGHIMARNVQFTFDASKGNLTQAGSRHPVFHKEITLPVLKPQPAEVISRKYSVPLSEAEWQQMKNDLFTVRIEGFLRYENGFGDVIEGPFCQTIVYDMVSGIGITYGGGTTFYPCNDIQSALDSVSSIKARVARIIRQQQK